MNLERFWIFSAEQLRKLHERRNRAYSEVLLDCADFDDRVLEKRDLRNLIKIVRSWSSSEHPLLRQKVVETAVNLFKRYFLVHSFLYVNPVQTILCAIYLSLKIEEIDQRGLSSYAERLMKKNIDPPATHYGEEGYTDHEMSFLAAINFQIKALSAIRPFESLLYRLKQTILDKTKQLRVEKEFLEILEMTYFDDLFFLVHPAKVTLCILLVVLEKNMLPLDCIDRERDIKSLLEEFPQEIDEIVVRVKQLKRFDHKDAEVCNKVSHYRSLMKGEEFKKPCLKRNSFSITSIPFPEPPKH